ncbi:hypothetical protein [Marinobacter sp. X15-166B]|uniref:hypothetical protein n=1 Tax=Marinobacter sp. X15-166B TaxID=1897620 RepID=UPI00085CC744|nr:hypothetical protein [Marinobacter sp. X15-166B]OEY66919.1 hypothetical protein BG841_10940 [Marinobacter sp. X15-166B]
MIGPLNPRGAYPLLPGKALAAEPSAAARRPVDGRQPTEAATPASEQPVVRRVAARQAADATRLERFRADELPLQTVRALSAFAGVAALGKGHELNLAGIDIHV